MPIVMYPIIGALLTLFGGVVFFVFFKTMKAYLFGQVIVLLIIFAFFVLK